MTAITTLDEFNALAQGSAVRTEGGSEYLLTTQGWQRVVNGSPVTPVIRPESFSGAVRSGHVSLYDATAPTVGSWWRDPSHTDHTITYVVFADDTTRPTYWRCLRFLRGGLTQQVIQTNSFRALERTTSEAVFGAERFAWVDALVAGYIEQREARVRAEAGASVINPDLVAEIHQVMDRFDDEDDTERLNDVLNRYGVARESEITVDVHVSGQWELSIADVAHVLGGSDVGGWVQDAGTIEFSRDIEVTKTGVGCQCNTITWADIRPFLPGVNIREDNCSWDVQGCDHH